MPDPVRKYYERERPIELRPVEFDRYRGKKFEDGRFNVWIRTTGRLPDDPAIHQCVLSYASDMTLLDTALVPHGRTLFEKDFMAASLDHALWLHRPFRADDWLLYSQDSPNLQGGRGFARGLIFTPRRHIGGVGGAGRPDPRAAADLTRIPLIAEIPADAHRLSGRDRRTTVRIRLISDLFVYSLRRDIPASSALSCAEIPKPTGGLSSMKLVTAIIKPFKLEDVRDALTKIGVNGMTVTEVKGYGRQKGHTEIYRGAEYAVNFLPKLRLEIGVASDRANAVVEAIAASAKTGQIGDGKIFVTEIDKAMRIRTGETDTDAL